MTPEVIVFPDTEELLRAYLERALPRYGYPVPVVVKIPDERPPSFVAVPRVGGTKKTLVTDGPTIGFQCWAARDKAASDLAQVVRALVHSLPGTDSLGVPVYRVQEFAGPVNLPESLSASPRYTFTAALDVRGRAVTPLTP